MGLEVVLAASCTRRDNKFLRRSWIRLGWQGSLRIFSSPAFFLGRIFLVRTLLIWTFFEAPIKMADMFLDQINKFDEARKIEALFRTHLIVLTTKATT